MRNELQIMREIAEEKTRQCLNAGDAESADAWTRIGTELDAVQHDIRHDWKLIQERQGLFRGAGAEVAAALHSALCAEDRNG